MVGRASVGVKWGSSWLASATREILSALGVARLDVRAVAEPVRDV